MNQQNPPQGSHPADDPSMEDILASIRRILNDGEDDSARMDTPAAAPTPRAPPRPEAVIPPAEDVFVLDQTMLIEEPAPMANEETSIAPQLAEAPDHFAEPAPQLQLQPQPQPQPQQETHAVPDTDEPLISTATAAAANASLGALVRVVGQRQTQVYRGGPSLEDIVRDEIRPLVKEWLDENLAPMVERMVRAEIERVTR